MTVNFLSWIGKAVPVFGVFILSAYFSGQSLAAECDFHFIPPRCNLGALPEQDLTINQATPDPIDFAVTVDISSFSETSVYQMQASIQEDGSLLKDKLIQNNFITLNNVMSFRIGSLGSAPFHPEFTTHVYDIPFIKTELIKWVDNERAKKFSFYACIRFHYSAPYYLGKYRAIDWCSEVPVNVKVDDIAHISGLKDITLPHSGEGFCVFSTAGIADKGGQVRLAVHSTHDFQLVLDSSGNRTKSVKNIGYTMKITDKNNEHHSGITLPGEKEQLQSKKWNAHYAEFTDDIGTDCLPKGDNMWLFIRMDGTEDSVPAGTYQDTITITVSPAS